MNSRPGRFLVAALLAPGSRLLRGATVDAHDPRHGR